MPFKFSLPYRADASDYFRALADLPWAIWLDSAGRDRYDILVAQPVLTLQTHGTQTLITSDDGSHYSSVAPLALLRQHLGEAAPNLPDVLFCGGALGYWSYDLAAQQPQTNRGDLPEMAVGIYDWALQIDHQEKTAYLVSQQRFAATEKNLAQILTRLQQTLPPLKDDFQVSGDIRSNFDRASYSSAFQQIQHYLTAGDCYQVNLAQRFSAAARGDALSAYLALREHSPAPFSAWMNLPFAQILCSSPERFLRLHKSVVETKPIKGTRPRGTNPQQDFLLKQDLQANPKDRAENLMIVDLLRNDLGKHCVVGSVKVSALFEVESYANVHHLVSTIQAHLRPEQDALSLLQDCLPGGSITGAPKQRAMEIIAQLEPDSRDVYCGALGYIGWDGNMDSNIVIRTLIYANGEIQFSVGGGIVADSQMENEYQETLDKAAALLGLLQQFGGQYRAERKR